MSDRNTLSDDDYEAIGEVIGGGLREQDQRIAALEDALDGTQRLRLSIKEWQMDREEEIRDLRDDLASLQRQMSAMQVELTLLQSALSPKHLLSVSDAIKTVRSIK